MMHPRAASVYLPAQDAVADDFLNTLQEKSVSNNGQIKDFEDLILRYTMECEWILSMDE